MTLPILWFIIIAVLISAYYVLDGFDLGAGIPLALRGKDSGRKARHDLHRSGLGWQRGLASDCGWCPLFAAFAPAYATVFSGFYLAIMLVLFGLIIRAVSLEFRAHDRSGRSSGTSASSWGLSFPLFSLASPSAIACKIVPLDAAGSHRLVLWPAHAVPASVRPARPVDYHLAGCVLARGQDRGRARTCTSVRTARVVMQVVTAVLVVAVSIMFFNFVGFPPGEAPACRSSCSSVAFWS